MAKTTEPEPTGQLDLTIEPDGYLLHVKGAKPIRLGTSEAARLGRELIGDRTPPHSDPPAPFYDEPADVVAEPTDETVTDENAGVVTDAEGVEHVGVLPAE